MTQFHWASQISGNFATAADWNPTAGAPPGSSDDAILDATGATAYTVTASASTTVNSIQTNGKGTLSITSGTFTATNGSGSGANSGQISVGNNTVFDAGGTLKNVGSVTLNSGGNLTDLVVATAGLQLTGGGNVTLSDNGSNRIYGATSGATLTNVDNTIQGGGQLGVSGLLIANQALGVINGNAASNALILNSGSNTDTNAGLIEGSSAAGLTIQGSKIDSSAGGTIMANGGVVRLQSADLVGGTLKDASGGTIETTDTGSLLDGSTSTVNNQASLAITNNTSLHLKGAINNTGSINLNSGGNLTDLDIESGGVTLSGKGSINLNNNTTANRILGSVAGVTLTNVDNTIHGSGALGNSNLTIVNQVGGTINGDNTGSVTLLLNTGANVVTNQGLIEATSSPGLTVQSTTINNAGGGLMQANGGIIRLQTAHIVDGMLTTSAGGQFLTVDAGSTLDGTDKLNPLFLLGTLNIANNTALTVSGTINLTQKIGKVVTNGTINSNSGGNLTDLISGVKNATLKGGFLNLSDNTANRLYGTISGKPGKTKVSNFNISKTIVTGAGNIGAGQLKLTNSGTLDATGANALTIQVGGSNTAGTNIVKNSGLIESTNPGALGSVGGMHILGSVILNDSKKGILEANGAGTHVDLQSATVQGGQLITLAGGVIQTLDANSVLDGTTLNKDLTVNVIQNKGTFNVRNNERITILGGIVNTGSINLNSGGNLTDLEAGTGGATLSGKGAVTMTDNTANRIYGITAATTLTNVDNTISGAGQIGAGQLTLVNQAAGVINATGGSTLTINVGTGAVTNSGLLEATGSGGLTIQSTKVDDSSGGVIQANTGSHVTLQSATLTGGTLKVGGTGFFQEVDSGSVLDGSASTFNNQALVNVNNNTLLTIKGAINNTGTFAINSGGNLTDLVAGAGGATLSGKGAITMTDNTNNRIYGATAATTLTNVDNTISGAGQIGAGQLTLINQASGVINATGTSSLTLNTGAVAVTNSGLIEATGSGGLVIQSTNVNGSSGGLIEANTGSHVNLQSATITGGTLEVTGTGFYQTADSGSLLDGTTSTVNNQGPLNVQNNQELRIQGTINNTGTIGVNSAGNLTDLVVTASNATLTGAGSVTLGDNSNNRFYGATAATVLTNKSTIKGAGQLGVGQLSLTNSGTGTINATGTNALTVNTGANTITNAGLMEATGTGGMTVNSAVNNTGTLKANGGLLDVAGAVSGAGTGNITGAGKLELDSTFTENVTYAAGSTGRLILGNSQGYTGTVTGFSLTGANDMDLKDINFATASKSYAGTATSGILTVQDTAGHTANIHLFGNYLSSTFVLAADSGTGTLVHDPAASGAHAIVAPH